METPYKDLIALIMRMREEGFTFHEVDITTLIVRMHVDNFVIAIYGVSAIQDTQRLLQAIRVKACPRAMKADPFADRMN